MTSASDPRIVLPVDPDGEQLIVFQPADYGSMTGWAVVWSKGRLFTDDAYGPDGGHSDLFIRLRFGRESESPDSALVVRELYLTSGRQVSGRFLRNVQLSRFEAAVNTPVARKLLDPLLKMSSTLIAWPWPENRRLSEHDERDWWLVPPSDNWRRQDGDPPQLKLDIPKGYGRPASFYLEVADRYGYLTTVSKRPANELAEANDVPVTTVHGWIKEARKRGFLPGRQSTRGSTRSQAEEA